MKRICRRLVLALTTMAAVACWAGTQNATVMGSVFSSGNAVAGVTVRLINASTAFSLTQTSSADGTFTFSDVPPAENYVISVEKTGFSPMVLTSVTVQVGEEKLVLPPFLLQSVAQAPSQTPVLTPAPTPVPAPTQPSAPARKAPSVTLDLLSSTESGVIDSQLVHTLPLVNRDFIDLALLVPGTFPVEQGSALQGASLAVNGARADMNNFLLDGADNNDYTVNQSLPFQIVEAMQEFRVQTSTSNAEYGRSGGAQINIVSRSGSNALHGELFEFNRNSDLAAGNYFSDYSGGGFNQYALTSQAVGKGDPLSDPTLAALYNRRTMPVNQNQFGGNIGGPLLRDKLFGFFNWESFRLANPRPLFEQVPGNTFRSASACDAQFAITCNPTALALYNLYPVPNVPLTQFTNPNSSFFGGVDDYGAFNVGQADNYTDSDNFLERVDWRVSSRISLSFKHNIQEINQLQAGEIPATLTYPGSGTHVGGRNQNVSFNDVHQLSARTTNEFRFGWNRFRLTTTALDASVNPAALGLQNLNFTNEGLPTVSIGGPDAGTLSAFSTLGSNLATPSNRADSVFSFADNVSLVRGRHSWKFGGEFRDIRLNVDNDALGRGLITFNAASFGAFNLPGIASIARVCPQFLPMFSSVFTQPCAQFGSGFERNFSTHTVAAYAQDQWRPWQNFTVSYGIRYEVNTAPVEVHNRLVNFYPSLATSLTTPGGLVQAGSTTVFDPEGDVIGSVSSPAPRAGFNTDTANWGPRFGFAWDPRKDGKTAVRAGYALMFDQEPLQSAVNQLLNPPFIQQSFGYFPNFVLADTFSACSPSYTPNTGGCVSNPPSAVSNWDRVPYSITAIDPHSKTPYIHQYHFGLEQQVGNNAVLELAYVGSAGRRLPLLRDISPCTTSEVFTNPTGCLNGFSFTSILDQANVGSSNFNSLQARVETRNFHGLQLQAFYQWSKSIDDASSLQPQVFAFSPVYASYIVSSSALPSASRNLYIDPSNFAGATNISPTLNLEGNLPVITTRPSLPQDSNNLAGERGPSDFDVRHTFVAAYSYEIPRWAPRIGTGWQVTGITTVRSGQPFTVFSDYFETPLRPSVSGPVHVNTNDPQHALSINDFNFTPSYNLEPGSLGRNAFTGPKYVDFDFALVKNTRLTERANLQFRGEFFNLFNNVNFHEPYSRAALFFTDITGNFSKNGPPNCFSVASGPYPQCSFVDPFFGQILQAFSARQIQLALKLQF
jgi:hypothetical protein